MLFNFMYMISLSNRGGKVAIHTDLDEFNYE